MKPEFDKTGYFPYYFTTVKETEGMRTCPQYKPLDHPMLSSRLIFKVFTTEKDKMCFYRGLAKTNLFICADTPALIPHFYKGNEE